MRAKKISLASAKSDKLFYVVANVIIYRDSDRRCLVLKRSTKEKLHPGKWCVPGGKLEWSDLDINKPTRLNGDVLDYEDAVEKLIVREVKEETGVELESGIDYINSTAYIRPDGIPSLMVKFVSRYRSGTVQLEKTFTDSAWVTVEEVNKLNCIRGIPAEVAQAVAKYSKNAD